MLPPPAGAAPDSVAAPPAEEAACVDAFDALPPEALLHILSLLPLGVRLRCGVLSRRWAELVRTPTLYAHLDFTVPTAGPRGSASGVHDVGLFRLCARAGAALRSLDVSCRHGAGMLTLAGLLRALRGEACEGLEELRTVSDENWDDDGAATVAATSSDTVFDAPVANWQLRLSARQASSLQRSCPQLRRGALALHAESPHDAVAALTTFPSSVRTRVDLIELRLEPACAVALSETLRCEAASGVRHLDLSYSGLGDAGATALASALAGNTTLRVLTLLYDAIGDAGAAALGAALATNRALRELNLDSNALGAAGARSLADGLAACGATSRLAFLRLDNNALDDEAAAALATLLSAPACGALRRLDMAGNPFGEAGALALAAALSSNATLTQLDLRQRHERTHVATAREADALRAAARARSGALHIRFDGAATADEAADST
jgi:hypothetical protein